MSTVSVVIPSYNSSRYLPGAIDSVLQQTIADFEVIVVDDGSNDLTEEVVANYASDPRIRYIRQENRGLPGARNTGARTSTGEFLAFLDADDFLAPNALDSMLRAFQSSGAAWLNVGVLKIEGTNRTVRHPITPSGDLLQAILEEDFVTRSPFYPRSEFFAIGMYDENMRNREDWDLNIRMIECQRPFVVIDEALYYYTRTEGSITTGSKHKLYGYTEMLLRKHHKRLADTGNREIRRIYAKNMWDLARLYANELHDVRKCLSSAAESLRYDFNIRRIVHPLLHHAGSALDGKD